MTNNYVLTLFLFSVIFTQAQITLNPNSRELITRDTFAKATNLSVFTTLSTAKLNANWDLTNVEYHNTPTSRWRSLANSQNYPNASFSKDVFYPFAGALSYESNIYTTISNSGITSMGEEVLVEQSLPLTALTGNSNDALIFPTQNISYSAVEKEMIYPLTMDDNWNGSFSKNTSFKLTVAAFGLNNTPGVRKSTITKVDTVLGWGIMKIKNVYTGLMHNHEVLQVKSIRTTMDSFFLGGALAPQSLLNAFGLTQGQVSTSSKIFFYRKSEIYPLVEIVYPANDFESAPTKLNIHQNRMNEYNLSLSDVKNSNVAIYPNPIIGNKIFIETHELNAIKATYNLKSSNGKIISKGRISDKGNGHSYVSVDLDLPKGIYFLSIDEGGKSIISKKLVK